MGPLIPFAASLGLKGLSALFGHKSKTKQYNAQRDATIAGLNVGQKRSEDSRRARLALANSLLSQVPQTTAGGSVQTHVALDPELVKRLDAERTYDFGSTVPKAAGGLDAFLAGLTGGAADIIPYLGKEEGDVQGGPAGVGSILPAPIAPTVPGADRNAGRGGVPLDESGGATPTLSLDDLIRLISQSDRSSQYPG